MSTEENMTLVRSFLEVLLASNSSPGYSAKAQPFPASYYY